MGWVPYWRGRLRINWNRGGISCWSCYCRILYCGWISLHLCGAILCRTAASIGGCGSAYGYAYAGLGEIVAWIIGWDLLLEYGLGISTVAIGWSGYVEMPLLLWALGFQRP